MADQTKKIKSIIDHYEKQLEDISEILGDINSQIFDVNNEL